MFHEVFSQKTVHPIDRMRAVLIKMLNNEAKKTIGMNKMIQFWVPALVSNLAINGLPRKNQRTLAPMSLVKKPKIRE